MTVSAESMQIMLQVGLAVRLIYIAFLKSYMTQKGKNLATKEDISGITKKVESIKQELRLVTETQLSIEQEERAALFDLYAKYYRWFVEIHSARISDLHQDRREQVGEMRAAWLAARFDFELAQGRAELLVDDAELRTTLVELAKNHRISIRHG